ncbi:MAG TPA: alpha/beta hydrolase [Dermatophilaceae bacterium]|nr:alpha/beta hydrolase [Dermatophilaceae bacterium]
MSRAAWPTVPAAELDERIRELEQAAYQHFGLETEEEMLPLHTPSGEVEVRVLQIGQQYTAQTPVLMLHGVGSYSVLAVEVMSYLTERRIIVLDWPGHGLSGQCTVPHPGALRGLAVAVVEGMLDELSVPVVDVVAHSLGGQFSCYAALDIPRRIRRLALVGCPGGAFPGGKPLPAMVAMAVPRLGERLMSNHLSVDRFERFNDVAIGPGAGAHLPDELHQACFYVSSRAVYANSVPSYLRAIIRGPVFRTQHNLSLADVERIGQPTLFAWGDRDAFLAPMTAAESIVAVRNHRLLRLPQAGHAPWLDEPELVGHAVVEHFSG